MIILGVRITQHPAIRGLGRRLPAILRTVMGDVAWYWHRHLLKRHFATGARARYRYRPRSKKYLRFKRRAGVGQGRFLDLWFSGRSRDQLANIASVSATSGRSTLRMTAPWYFVRPNGTIKNRRNRKFSSRRQPDKSDEVTRADLRDETDLRAFAAKRLLFFIQQAQRQRGPGRAASAAAAAAAGTP